MLDQVSRAADPAQDTEISRGLLAQMDEAATSREHWKILLTSGMGFFTDAYDLFVIGVAATMIVSEWHIASYQKSLLSSLALLTSAAGAVFFGHIADRLGRRKVYGYEVLVLAGGAVVSAFAPGIWWLIAFRAILGFGIGGDYPVSATIMSEYAARRHRGRMVALVFSMQGAGLVAGPLVAIGLLSLGISQDLTWRIMLALGAVPALAVFWLRRQIRETPRFLLAQMEAREAAEQAARAREATGIRGVLAERRLRRWLIGASLAWLLFDFVYYGNTISSPLIVKLADPHASLLGTTTWTLAIFAVAALPGYLLAAATIDTTGRRALQATGFAVMAAAFAGLWLIPGATTTLTPFLLLFGATYFFAEFGPNTTTFVYPAEIFPVRVRTTSHGIAAAAGKMGAFIGTYALTALLPAIGLSRVSALVAAVSVLGLLVTVTLLPEPKGVSLEQLTEAPRPPPGPMRSLEVRWILPGQLGTAMAEWFARFPAREEAREDTYLVDPQPGGISVKFRHGRALELKAYQGSPGILEVAGRACGRLERWDKWSFPSEAPDPGDAGRPGWRPVRKLIRKFPAVGGHSAAGVRRQAGEPRCEVELTEIQAGGQTWWTLGFEATGPDSQLRAQLEAAAALVFAQALPGGMELDTDHSQSYLQWLTGGQPPRPPAPDRLTWTSERPARLRHASTPRTISLPARPVAPVTAVVISLAQRAERGAHLAGEQVWLFPGGEVAAAVEPAVVDEVAGVGAFGPAARGPVELVREDADGVRDRDGLGVEEVRLVLPVQAGSGDPGVRQPVERDVVQEVVPGQGAVQGARQDALHEPGLAGAVAVVEHERREVDRGVGQAVQGLRAGGHDLRVGQVLGEEGAELLVGGFLLRGQVRRRRVAALDRGVDGGRSGAGHVGVNAGQFGCGLYPHLLGDGRAPVAALGHEADVTQALHQDHPGPGDPGGIPAGRRRLGREPVPGQRGDHQVEGVRRGRAVRGGVGERADDLQLLDDRAGPAVRDDQRQRAGVPGADVDEVDVQPVDLGDEVRQLAEPGLARAPVVAGGPVAGQVLHHRERDALRVVGDRLALGPPGRGDAPAQLGELGLREADLERADGGVFGGHVLLLVAGDVDDGLGERLRGLDRGPPVRPGGPAVLDLGGAEDAVLRLGRHLAQTLALVRGLICRVHEESPNVGQARR
jgi:MFS transporter, PHS family, inorganic phosphate transporter